MISCYLINQLNQMNLIKFSCGNPTQLWDASLGPSTDDSTSPLLGTLSYFVVEKETLGWRAESSIIRASPLILTLIHPIDSLPPGTLLESPNSPLWLYPIRILQAKGKE